jgi:hypothetical protein
MMDVVSSSDDGPGVWPETPLGTAVEAGVPVVAGAAVEGGAVVLAAGGVTPAAGVAVEAGAALVPAGAAWLAAGVADDESWATAAGTGDVAASAAQQTPTVTRRRRIGATA